MVLLRGGALGRRLILGQHHISRELEAAVPSSAALATSATPAAASKRWHFYHRCPVDDDITCRLVKSHPRHRHGPFPAVPATGVTVGGGSVRCIGSSLSTTNAASPSTATNAAAGPASSPVCDDAAAATTSLAAGEAVYREAMGLLRNAHEGEKEREEGRSKKMYEAWQKSQERDPKTQGVTVIRTLVRETQREGGAGGDRPRRRSLNSLNNIINNNDTDKYVDEGDPGQRAIELLRLAARIHHHPEAAVQLGNMLLGEASTGLARRKSNRRPEGGVEDDLEDEKSTAAERKLVEEAMGLFRLAGEAGSRVGWYNLGQLLWTGFPPTGGGDGNDDDDDDEGPPALAEERGNDQILPEDMDEAMKAFLRAIDLDDQDAMYLVGVHRLSEGGGEEDDDYRSGTELIERAAGAGHGGALYYLALLRLNGEECMGLEPSPSAFPAYLDRAVEAGSTDARFTRGHSYYHGTEGYPQDFRRALDDFLRAADEGHADSAVSAGAMLHHGVGVLKDQRRAFELYQAAGELGSEEGWVNVIDCWRQGLGVPKSEDTARHIEETMVKRSK